MTAPPCEPLAAALGHLYEMLTVHRGFVAEPSVASAFARWSAVRLLPMSTPHYGTVCELIYRCALMRTEPGETAADATAALRRHGDSTAWLASRARNLLFTRADAAAPYAFAIVVITAGSGPDATAKLEAARAQAETAATQLRQSDLPSARGRIIRLALGPTPRRVAPTRVNNEFVSTEVWFVGELQTNPLEHELVPRHLVYAHMSAAERARLPPATRAAAEGDITRLDVLRTSDPVARWCDFVPGQVICIERRNLFEGGVSYALRRVAP